MTRKEFPARVRAAVIKRSMRDGTLYCEKCGAMAKRSQVDHVRPDGLLGEPTIENAMLICEACYTEKNAKDTTDIARAKRIEAKHIGAIKPKGTMRSAGFRKSEKRPAIDKSVLAPLPRLHPVTRNPI